MEQDCSGTTAESVRRLSAGVTPAEKERGQAMTQNNDLWASIKITDESWQRFVRFVARNQFWFEPPSDPWAFIESGERVRIWPSDEWWDKYWEKYLDDDDAEWETYCRDDDDAETQRPTDKAE
jgi:hypothetical protein